MAGCSDGAKLVIGIVRVVRRLGRAPGVREDYPDAMEGNGHVWIEQLTLPEGMVYLPPTHGPDPSVRRYTLEEIEIERREPPITDLDAALRRIDEKAGCISIGRAPRRSDYRGRGKWS